ncbi:MAG: hypothetical protein M3Q19_00485 [Pseudomonadota bacterium]|nr:hypothetical protein [Pseudomonadota bacterium]
MADDNQRDADREKRTVIVTTDGERRGSGVIILLVALVVILLAVLFFGGIFDRDDESDLNIDLNAPPDINLTLPETQPLPPPVIIPPDTQAPPPDVNVNVALPPPAEDNLSDVEGVTTNSG